MSDRVAVELTFQCEPALPLMAEAKALFDKHFDEIAVHKDLFGAPNPDIELYEALAAKGLLRAVTARADGKLVGYFAFIVKRNAHYRHVVAAIEDLYFLAPEHRRGSAGYRFLAYAVRQMEATGAHYLSMRTKVDHNNGVILERLGFRKIEHVYQRVNHG